MKTPNLSIECVFPHQLNNTPAATDLLLIVYTNFDIFFLQRDHQKGTHAAIVGLITPVR